ncbi:MAG: glycosyltransferase family 4 protein [Deltaproteobacteria bacterium]|nr:glycosyltransferase family 4 protein [Deltaproteobacteria bacterium]
MEIRADAVVGDEGKGNRQIMTAAIYFHPEAYTTSGPKLMGRNAAGESFLRGFLAHSRANEFWAQVEKPEHAQAFAQAVKGAGRNELVKAIDKNSLATLSQPGVVYYPGPGIGEHAWHRAAAGAAGHGSWSLCGITHTTSSAGAMDALAELLTAPVQPWDAVICTSLAVKDNVTRLLQAQADYLVQRLGVQRLVLPQLPVIPLGIHTQDFAYSDGQKAAARAAIGADEHTLVVLYTGRLSFHAKAHPLAMYQALEKAVATVPAGQNVVLVECGWHANEYIAKAYADAAQLACPSVRVVTLDGRILEHRQTAWASADVFCSLSDNIQETFGIVPIEAMAAGISVVVADWDGYKDTVRADIDGFRIPTLMPGAGLGTDLALRHALEIDTYDMYCGHACSLVAVDVEATAQAFVRLFASADLRKQMGEAGRKRAREVYDWSVIIPQYESLWDQLTETRKAQASNLNPSLHPWPARMDPFHAFASYPTKTLTPEMVLGLVDTDIQTAQQRVADYRQLAMVNFAKVVLPSEAEVLAILDATLSCPKTAAELIQAIPVERQPLVFRALVWLVKLGILKVCA